MLDVRARLEARWRPLAVRDGVEWSGAPDGKSMPRNSAGKSRDAYTAIRSAMGCPTSRDSLRSLLSS
eukprot:808333-Pyramimonas_sp.AAC.1